ncbi:uncharacterized protein V6R79_013753 [Siganus canaliculatus]
MTNTLQLTNCSGFDNLPVRMNMSTIRNEAVYRPIMTVPHHYVPQTLPVCFSRHSSRTDNVEVGNSTNCNITLPATCGAIWNITTCNTTEPTTIQWGDLYVHGPSDDSALMITDGMWLCGDALWQLLPPHWSGVCGIVFLTPSITVYDKLHYSTHHYPHYRQRRDAETVMVSPEAKAFGGIFPWWGTINNAHKIDTLHIQLENLTTLVGEGFSALQPWVAAVRATLVQNRMGLDLLFASQGGLCHIIGDSCCTYVPDVTSNMSVTVDHLNDVLAEEKKDVVHPSAGWSFWDWLSWGDWRGKLLSLVAPLLTVFIVFCVITTCIVPCIKKGISRMIRIYVQAALTPYQPVADTDAADTDSDWSEDEQTV